ncbi:hypothetical protein [Rhizobium sp. 2YAF20]|uniref:hypothetical protein n=1 Tax=Rhizobium sp. 2YAF20 TaxID=3233027 RepID=UPI003F9CEA3D
MEFEWDASKRRQVTEKHGIDIPSCRSNIRKPRFDQSRQKNGLWARAMDFAGRHQKRMLHRRAYKEKGCDTAYCGHGREVGLNITNIKRASLEDIKKMTAEGKVLRPTTTPVAEELPDDFWAAAVVVEPKAVKSVHLKIDAEFFDFSKRRGKGHLTHMQDVLKAYVRAKSR